MLEQFVAFLMILTAAELSMLALMVVAFFAVAFIKREK